jgi:hypothetical protein
MMRARGDADRTVLLGIVAAYAAGALIMLSVLVSTALWPVVASGL